MEDEYSIGREGAVPAPLGGAATLEEHQTFVLHAPDARRAWLGERLLASAGTGRWLIPVGYWAAQRTLTLRIEALAGVRRATISIRPAAHKLSPEQWAAMVDDVERLFAGATLGAEGGVHGAVAANGVADGVGIEVLTTLVPALLRAVDELVRSPRRREEFVEEDLAPYQIRRIDPAGARLLARGATRIPTAELTSSLDHPANRWLAHQLRAVRVALDKAAGRLTGQVAVDAFDADRIAWAHSRGARCAEAAEALGEVLTTTFLGRLPPGDAGESVLPILTGDPVYGRVHRIARVLLHPRFRLDGDGPGAPLRPSYTLWELWCFRQAVFAECLARPGFIREDHLAPLRSVTGEGAKVTLRSTDGNRGCSVHFNETFRALAGGGRYSLSREMRPDIVIREWSPNVKVWRAMDAKWRVGRTAVADSFESVHRYRDALVDESFGGRPASVLLVVPHRQDAPDVWFQAEWQARWGGGVVNWVPG